MVGEISLATDFFPFKALNLSFFSFPLMKHQTSPFQLTICSQGEKYHDKKLKSLLHLKSDTEDFSIIEGKFGKVYTQPYFYEQSNFDTFQ